MPRKSRIDTQGDINHILARGIDRKNIFKDDTYRMVYFFPDTTGYSFSGNLETIC